MDPRQGVEDRAEAAEAEAEDPTTKTPENQSRTYPNSTQKRGERFTSKKRTTNVKETPNGQEAEPSKKNQEDPQKKRNNK